MNKKRIFSGQTLVEFALILPIFLLLVLGFFDLGRAVFYYSSLSNAVREGTRDGVVMNYTGDTVDEIKDSILGYAFGLTGTSNPLTKDDIVITISDAADAEGGIFTQQIEIKATYCFTPVTPGINLLLDTTCGGSKGIVLTADSLMWMEP
jgi:Flp pilus assembly protein TadG